MLHCRETTRACVLEGTLGVPGAQLGLVAGDGNVLAVGCVVLQLEANLRRAGRALGARNRRFLCRANK